MGYMINPIKSTNKRKSTATEKFEAQEKAKRKILVCLEKAPRKVNGVEVLPVSEFLKGLWSGDLF